MGREWRVSISVYLCQLEGDVLDLIPYVALQVESCSLRWPNSLLLSLRW